ncbi:protease modulator HflC [Cyclobacterium marinum]|uniref:Protein HflC n=1 Tax=Cyclobacterium marinum (strain ATCC 25205 / DSM 745 / LMG 13164 / NCIMB 1802) TaxID=880070 RepID=G0IZK8_CYCMS|nr:protease modulator HflC [Cyclobacterium marinum]AEL25049.1 HflC protein [Cyclobacterium marinum DSM 745]MBI0401481.1 protease modulator HflC [Cyclobacterium marinum]MBR9773602.1 protease modulator HflC [Cytophagales bacterium]|tara:strand:+ start:28503 stop:29441 length:939 start_codon:yes stop_codon:yes gene_type:complete
MKKSNLFYIILVVVAVILSAQSVFILDETQQAIVTQFGKPVGEPRTSPGVNIVVPFIQKVQFFDKRYLEWDGDKNQVPTKDKKYIFVDTYARWEITNPLQFFIRLRDERSAQSRLDDILDGETRNAIANHNLLDIVRSTNREPEVTEEFMEELEILEEIEVGRDKIEDIILQKANERTSDLGVRILDFRFKRMNYVDEVRDRVYDRMISERNRIADQFRSEGQGEARKILGDKERDLAQIQSEAQRQAEEIRGRADAEATEIYASAYNQNRQSIDLYKFLRSMEALENSLDEETNLVISSDSDLFKYLKQMN